MRRKQKNRESNALSTPNGHNNSIVRHDIESIEDATSADQEHLFNEMQSTAITKENISSFKENLAKTLEYRLKMASNDDGDLLRYFPYFFTHPELVNYYLFVTNLKLL